jgi:hypothetical protein
LAVVNFPPRQIGQIHVGGADARLSPTKHGEVVLGAIEQARFPNGGRLF